MRLHARATAEGTRGGARPRDFVEDCRRPHAAHEGQYRENVEGRGEPAARPRAFLVSTTVVNWDARSPKTRSSLCGETSCSAPELVLVTSSEAGRAASPSTEEARASGKADASNANGKEESCCSFT